MVRSHRGDFGKITSMIATGVGSKEKSQNPTFLQSFLNRFRFVSAFCVAMPGVLSSETKYFQKINDFYYIKSGDDCQKPDLNRVP